MVDKVSAGRSSSVDLRSNFQQVKAGVSVKPKLTASDTDAVENSVRSGNVDAKKLADLVSGLKEAVSFSSRALDSLNQVASGGGEANIEGFDDLVEDLGKLEGDIGKVLGGLKDKADAVSVLQENFDSSASRISDVDAAAKRAESTGSQILRESLGALDAHSGLAADKVAFLLDE